MKYKILKTIPFIATLIALFGCSTKAPIPPKSIQKSDYTYLKEYLRWYIQKEMDEKDIVGLSVALVDDQKIVWREGFGYADKKLSIKATPHTKYRAGSITKVFNAMAVMKLVEQKKMDIDKPFVTYLPEFSIKSRFGSTDGITARNILTHHSGLPSNWVDRMFATDPLHYSELVKVITDEYVAYPPNTIFNYSNLAITLLGHSVQRVSGQPYAQFLQTHLLSPLGMRDSDLKMALSGKKASKSYSGGEETIEYSIGQVSAGALNTTVVDLSKLAMMVNGNGTFESKTILEPKSLQEMFRVQNGDIELDLGEKMGLGWLIDDTVLADEESVYWHSGGTIAHMSSFAVAPKSKLGVVVLSNSDSADPVKIANTVLQKAWEIKTGKKLSFKKELKPTSLDFEGTYTTMMGKVDVIKKSDNHYVAKTSSGSFNLKSKDDNGYKPKYLLFGFIPIGNEELDSFTLYTKNIKNHHVAIAQKDNHNYLIGIKAESKSISDVWKGRLGEYKILNNLEPKSFKIKNLELKIEDDFLVAVITVASGEKMIEILQIANDNEVIIEGLGVGKRETIRAKVSKDGYVLLFYRGLEFRLVKTSQTR